MAVCDYPQLMYKSGDERTKNKVKIGIYKEDVYIPCGKCYNCRLKRLREWIFRCQQEGKAAATAFFVTLTYDPEHIPITERNFMTLRKTDLQKYFKKLRKTQEQKITYLAVGEYGTQKKRPHYHVLLFNVRNVTEIVKCWTHGTVHIGQLTQQSISYTLEYMTMKDQKVPEWMDIEPLFKVQSTGLGKSYLNSVKQMVDSDLYRLSIDLQDGTKIAIPKYYIKKILDESHQQKRSRYLKKWGEYYSSLNRKRKGDETIERERRSRVTKLNSKKTKKE